MNNGIRWHRDRVTDVSTLQRLEQYIRGDMAAEYLRAYDSAKTMEATEPTGITGWVADPQVDGTYAFAINGDVAFVVYTQDPHGWGWDFECADWFELLRGDEPYPWERQ